METSAHGGFYEKEPGSQEKVPSLPDSRASSGDPLWSRVEASILPLGSEPELAADTKAKGTKVPSLGP